VFFSTLQTTHRVKEKYFSIYAKRRIHIIKRQKKTIDGSDADDSTIKPNRILGKLRSKSLAAVAMTKI
jgi:hypothetical protein